MGRLNQYSTSLQGMSTISAVTGMTGGNDSWCQKFKLQRGEERKQKAQLLGGHRLSHNYRLIPLSPFWFSIIFVCVALLPFGSIFISVVSTCLCRLNWTCMMTSATELSSAHGAVLNAGHLTDSVIRGRDSPLSWQADKRQGTGAAESSLLVHSSDLNESGLQILDDELADLKRSGDELTFRSQTMKLFVADPKGWLGRERALLEADRKASLLRNLEHHFVRRAIAAGKSRPQCDGQVSKHQAAADNCAMTPITPAAQPSSASESPPRSVTREDKAFDLLHDYCPP